MTPITEDEKLLRQRSNASVFGTFAMEGLKPDEATRKIFLQYETGEFTLDQFSEAMDQHAYSLLAKHGKLSGAA